MRHVVLRRDVRHGGVVRNGQEDHAPDVAAARSVTGSSDCPTDLPPESKAVAAGLYVRESGDEPSPLAGVTFQATFVDPITGTTRRARSASARAPATSVAVRADTSLAMHPLNGAGVPGALYGVNLWLHAPRRLPRNSDLWLYDLRAHRHRRHRGQLLPGNRAGVRARGYLGQQRRADARQQVHVRVHERNDREVHALGLSPIRYSRPRQRRSTVAMADYHQACIRAATADYCANGTSFTKDGTLIDIYDYQPHEPPTRRASFRASRRSIKTRIRRPLSSGSRRSTSTAAPSSTSCATAGSATSQRLPRQLQPRYGAAARRASPPAARDPTTCGAVRAVDNTTTCSHDETTSGVGCTPGAACARASCGRCSRPTRV